jgi:IstB-like ATP binding protein
MKTAVIGEDPDGLVVYNRALLDLARHYGFQPRACRPYRAKTKGKVERPFRYIREDFFLGGVFRNLDDLNGQLRRWLDTIANPRLHATTHRVVNEAFAEEKPALKPLPLGTGKTHLGLALGVEAVKAGRSVYFSSLADIVASLARAEREGALRERIRYFCRFALLIVDEIGYLPVIPGGGNLFFQLVNARYEKGAMILTSNRGFAEWGDIFGDSVVATALLDRLLHHAVVLQIDGSSYRLREHADLLPEHIRSKASLQPIPIPPTLKRRGRPPKKRRRRSTQRLIARPPNWGILLRRFWGKSNRHLQKGPARAALGRFGTSQGNQFGFLLAVENPRNRRRRALLAAQHRLEALFHQLLAHPVNHGWAGLQRFDDPAVAPAFPGFRDIGLQQDPRLRQPLGRALSFTDQGFKLLPLIRAQPHHMLLY